MIDTSEMNVVHVVFRREFWQLPGLVRGVEPGDTTRAGVVASHADFMLRWLSGHHSAEDVALWPVLADRVPDHLAALMTEQHQAAHEEIDAACPLLTRWRSTADVVVRESLARTLDRLHAVLMAHLDAEEQQMLPVAAEMLSTREWEHFLSVGRSGRISDLPLSIGMLRYETDPDRFRAMLADMPRPVRTVILHLATRSFRAHSERVYRSSEPPRVTDRDVH